MEQEWSFEERYDFNLLVEPKSLLLLTGQLYTQHLQGIKEVDSDILISQVFGGLQFDRGAKLTRNTLVSLTIRHVPNTKKTKKLNLQF